jgi:uncharacterized repeat protein (TIGR04052 family)
MLYKHNKTAAALLGATLLFAGCGSDDNDTTTQENGDGAVQKEVTIDFRAMMGNESVACSENNQTKVYTNVGTSDESVTIKDFRFFVSEVKFIKADGTKVPLTLTNNDNQYQKENGDHVAILDFEDNTGDCIDRGNTPETYTTLIGTIPDDTYSDIEFTLGVPFDINHDSTSYADIKALNQPMMSWSWQAGRKFTKIELHSQTDPSLVWNFHLGSTGCVATTDTNSTVVTESCAQPNRIQVRLQEFNPQTNAIKVNYKSLLRNNDVAIDLGMSKGCMSGLTDPECDALFTGLALDVANQTGTCINGGDCSSQTLFMKITK